MDMRTSLVNGLGAVSKVNPQLVAHVKDYRTRGVIPVYRVPDPQTPRVRGFPYKETQSFDISTKNWNDVRAGRILICSTHAISEYDKIISARPRW